MELEILKQQQQQVDNYSTVPMDIEDEDTAGEKYLAEICKIYYLCI